jgi:hypothetical protein
MLPVEPSLRCISVVPCLNRRMWSIGGCTWGTPHLVAAPWQELASTHVPGLADPGHT